jgi:diguanylate cyclase (GGDEF)-like protein
MAPSPVLDTFTLLVCGNALLLAMALTLAAVSGHRGDTSHALHLWIASLLLFVAGDGLVIVAARTAMSAWFPPLKAGVAGVLAAFTVMQLLAVQQLTRGGVAWSAVLKYCLPALALTTALASVLPTVEARGAVIAFIRSALPLFALWRLFPLRRRRGAWILLAATAAGMVFSLAAPAMAPETDLIVVYAIGGDITSIFVSTLGLLLWHQEHIEQRLTLTATTDSLTGVLNRHGVMSRLEQELARAERTGRSLSVALCDLDHFKRVNDRHGHAVGDLVLQDFAKRACGLIRRQDIFGRWGGEEFLLILPETTLEQAALAADRLRLTQGQASNGLPTVTLSAGVASVPHADWGFCSATELLASADHLLHVAKETRDRVVSLATVYRDAASAQPLTHARGHEYADTTPPASTG